MKNERNFLTSYAGAFSYPHEELDDGRDACLWSVPTMQWCKPNTDISRLLYIKTLSRSFRKAMAI